MVKELQQYIHDIWADMITDPAFPCVGAAGAVRRGDYLHETYTSLTEVSAAKSCARSLKSFNNSRSRLSHPVAVFAASFAFSYHQNEEEFESELWAFLAALCEYDQDSPSNSSQTIDEPDDIGFIFDGRHFFVVGMHPLASRPARQFAVPTLVFNALSHVAPLVPNGRFERMKTQIRKRDARLSGYENPSSELPRRAQFSGRQNDPEWTPPHQ
ncbi:YqcI/YcgG family protein [Brevibacterium sediminis]|nr:YqcI/YcgG family protein [Brevibacterium sediminis]